MDIKYVEMTKKDHKDIKRLITEAWFSDYPFKQKYIKLYASGYLNMYLSESDYKIVAKDGDKIVGFIFGNLNKAPLKQRIISKTKLFFYAIYMLFSYPGRRGLKITQITNRVNKELLKPFKKELKNELILFIVDENYRGKGIGTQLEKMYTDFLKENKVQKMFLFTDTYSNFEYYEQRGYERKGSLPVDFKTKHEEIDPVSEYYIYIKEL